MLAFVLVPMAFHFLIVSNHSRLGFASGFGLFKLGFVTVAALSHWGIYTGLLLTFGLTLQPGHTPLITAMAQRMHGELSAEMLRYTRKVTFAWCGFFAAQLSMSILLFCFAPLAVWSCFVNILDVPLVAAMFAAEYCIRLRSLQNPPRHSFSTILNMIADAERPRAGAPVGALPPK